MPKSASFSANGGEATLTFEWTYATVKMSNMLNDAGERIFPPQVDPITQITGTTWNDLTNQEKVDFLLVYVTRNIVSLARNEYTDDQRAIYEVQIQDDLLVRLPGDSD